MIDIATRLRIAANALANKNISTVTIGDMSDAIRVMHEAAGMLKKGDQIDALLKERAEIALLKWGYAHPMMDHWNTRNEIERSFYRQFGVAYSAASSGAGMTPEAHLSIIKRIEGSTT